MDDFTTLPGFDEVREELQMKHKCACDLCVAEQIARRTNNLFLLDKVKRIKNGNQ
jgi:hypothetical protein